MKTVKIELPDEDADALAEAAAVAGYASTDDLVLAVIGDYLAAPVGVSLEQIDRDIAAHKAAKARGVRVYTYEEALEWPRDGE